MPPLTPSRTCGVRGPRLVRAAISPAAAGLDQRLRPDERSRHGRLLVGLARQCLKVGLGQRGPLDLAAERAFERTLVGVLGELYLIAVHAFDQAPRFQRRDV